MKRVWILLVCCAVAAALAGCGVAAEPTQVTEVPETTAEPETQPTEPVPQVTAWSMYEPQWFLKTEETADRVVWMNPKMAEDPSNIILMVSPRDPSILDMDADAFLLAMEETADAGSMVVNEVYATEVDGYRALYADYSYTMDGIPARSYGYYLVASETYSFVFTDCTADGRWAEAYAASAATIELLLEGEFASVHTEGLEHYDELHQGINIYAEPDLTEKDVERIAAYLTNGAVAMEVRFDMNTKKRSAQEYYDWNFRTINTYMPELSVDKYGNLSACYVRLVGEAETPYYYFVSVKDVDGYLYTVFLYCHEELSPYYAEQFPRWAASLTVDEKT